MTSDLKNYSQYSELLSKLLTDRLTSEEAEQLEVWKNKSEKNLHLYNKITSPHYIKTMKKNRDGYDAIGAYMEVRKKYRHKQMIGRFRKIAVAAAFLLPCIAGVQYWTTIEKTLEISIAMNEIRGGGSKAELTLFDGERIVLDENVKDTIRIQSGGQVIATGKSISYEKIEEMIEMEYNTLRVPRGGEFELTLTDGTVITLNSDSEVRYPVKFSGEERRIYLSGEAFLDVAKDAKHPFIVAVGNSEIRVLGTSFNVQAYATEGKVFTTLVEGAVEMSSGNEKIKLNPGEQCVADSTGILTKHKVDTELYTGWKEGKLIFREQTLETVMKTLARWYNIEVIFENPEAKKILFTGNVRRYDSFEKILKMLEVTGDTRFEVNGNKVSVKDK